MSFVHLHLHTQYSVLDGANKLKDVIKLAQAHNQPAVAITDHGVMHGAVELYSMATEAGIRPIIGCEVYITSGSRHDRTPRSQGGPTTHHLTLLCKDMKGYRNLCQLVTFGYSEGFYHRPRIDFEILSQFSEGLICLSGCMASQLAECSKRSDEKGAIQLIDQYRQLFDGRYYLEIQPHCFCEQQQHNIMLKDLAEKMSLPLVATNDVHYPTADDHFAQEVLMCVSTGKLITDEDRIKHTESRLHFKTREEMLAELPEFESALDMTVAIANQCELEFDFKSYHMPQFEPGDEQTVDALFAAEARKGMEDRFSEWSRRGIEIRSEQRETYSERLEEEIILIGKMGFSGYFLVVSDFIRWAKRNNIPVGPGRGSAAGSLVAYALSITEIDPIPYSLLFERFLNPERVSLPDIDVDFCINGRDKVIEYVTHRYGKEKVAQILTFGTLKAKAAIKDVGRALGLSYAETDRIAKLIPAPRQGFDYPIAQALEMEPRLREYAAGDGKQLMELAQKLEGLTRHTSTHAAGLVISNRPIVEHLPLMVDKDGQVVTQYSMNWVEKIGLVKFDFLGLKTLSVLHEAVRLIKEVRGKDIDLNALPLDDPRTYKVISSGRTIGIFQLESSGITDMVTRLKPSCFDDLVAILALYRPGPLDAGMVDHYINRKHGREQVRVLHPSLKPILQDTYGIILYQEQIMQIARDMAGYSLGEADMLRRAMGKKKPEEMAKQRERFLSGSKERQVDPAIASEVFDQMETFARYGFNKSHSVAYAMISFQTGYLKAHYPAEFLAALMTFEMGDTDKTLKNLTECREMGIPVTTPDVNRGQVGFTVVDKTIIFGLAAIKSVGSKAVEQIIEDREKNGPFECLYGFCKRIDSSLANRRLLENFIKAGAFDWTKLSRAEMLLRLEEVMRVAGKAREQERSPQMGLFGASAGGGDSLSFQVQRELLPEAPVNVKLAMERDALGFYLSGHPLEKFTNELKRLGTLAVSDLKTTSDGSQVNVAGVITFLKLKNTKKGDRYATFTLEDLVGTVEVIVWPDTYQKVQDVLSSEDPIILNGRLDVSDERRSIIANEIQSAIALRDKTAREAVIRLSQTDYDQKKLVKLQLLLSSYQGDCKVKLVVIKPQHSETVISLDVSIAPSEELCNQVEQLFGSPVLSFR
jgi:DNA polymerase-3 subunit alpha